MYVVGSDCTKLARESAYESLISGPPTIAPISKLGLGLLHAKYRLPPSQPICFGCLTMEGSEDPRPTLEKLRKLYGEYTTAGGVLDDSIYKSLILGILPYSYANIIREIMLASNLRIDPITHAAKPFTPDEPVLFPESKPVYLDRVIAN